MDKNELNTFRQEWDYTQQAKYYYLRPNYSPEAIDQLLDYIKPAKGENYLVADIGAGTGNLSLLLEERGLKIIALEPNSAMSEIGKEKSKAKNIQWQAGTGEKTGLADKSVDLITFGSSFNTTDRDLTLKEAHRVLKDNGYFVCMWNNRELKSDPWQNKTEEIIKKFVPDYSHGVRREDQTDIIKNSGLFKDIKYFEAAQKIKTSPQNYLEAWKSVKNKYWDLETEAGRNLFNQIISALETEFNQQQELEITYLTRIWTAQKQN